MKVPRVRFSVRWMMIAVALCASLIGAAICPVPGVGTAYVEFVNMTGAPIGEVVIDSAGGQITARDLAPGGSVLGKVKASGVRPDLWFDVPLVIRVARSAGQAKVWRRASRISPNYSEPYLKYELVEGPGGQASLKEDMWFTGKKRTPRYKLWLWDKQVSLGLWR